VGLVFHKLHINESTAGVTNNILYLQKVCKRYTVKQGLKTTPPWPNAASEAIPFGPEAVSIRPQRHFVSNEKLTYLQKNS